MAARDALISRQLAAKTELEDVILVIRRAEGEITLYGSDGTAYSAAAACWARSGSAG